jgi:hypothetical protein
MSGGFPEEEDLREMLEAAGCQCCALVCPITAWPELWGREGFSDDGYTQDVFFYATGDCAAPQYQRRRRVYAPDGEGYEESFSCVGKVPEEARPWLFSGTYELIHSPVRGVWPPAGDPVILPRAFNPEEVESLDDWGRSTRYSRVVTEALVRFGFGTGVSATRVRARLSRITAEVRDAFPYTTYTTETVFTDWVDGPPGDVMTYREVTVPLPVPTPPPAVDPVSRTEQWYEWVETQCVGYRYTAPPEERVECFDAMFEPVGCDSPDRVFCYTALGFPTDCFPFEP